MTVGISRLAFSFQIASSATRTNKAVLPEMTADHWNTLKTHVCAELQANPKCIMSVGKIRKFLGVHDVTLKEIEAFYDDDDEWFILRRHLWSQPLDDPAVELEFSRRGGQAPSMPQ